MVAPGSKFILITGANSGIGFAVVKLLLQASPAHHVLLASRDPGKGETCVQNLQALPDIQGQVTAIQLDITSQASIDAAVSHIHEVYGRIDTLVNNAGICQMGGDVATLRRVLETNVVGAYAVTDAFQPLLLASSAPQLIFVTSSLGSLTMGSDPKLHQYRAPSSRPQFSDYRISKAAMNMVMLEYKKALEDSGVKTWGVDPGMNRTRLIREMHEDDPRRMALAPPETGAQVIVDVILGKRDSDMGSVVWADGVRPW